GAADQWLGRPESLQGAGRQTAYASRRMSVQTQFTQRGFDLRRAIGRREVVERRVILERLADGEERIVPCPLWDISEPWWHVVPRYVFSKPGDTARVGAEQTGETEKERRFARSRAAHKPDYLASVGVERDVAQRGNRDRPRLM